MYPDFAETLQALPKQRLLGRDDALEALHRRVADGSGFASPLIAVSGFAGIGKSEFLRAFAIRLLEDGEAVLPLYFDFSPYGISGPEAPALSAENLWAELHQSLVRQIVAHSQELPLLAPPLCGAGARELAEFAYTAGLGDWISRLTAPSPSLRDAEQTWRGILHHRATSNGPRPVIFFDGLSLIGRGSEVWSVLRGAVRGARAESIAVLMENGRGIIPLWPEIGSVDRFELQGLPPGNITTLIEMIESPNGDAAAVAMAERVSQRLGGNPLLIRHWVEAWREFPDIRNKIRRAESTYVRLISASLPARRWRACFERVIPPAARPTMLRALAAFSEPPRGQAFRTFSTEEFQLRASLSRETAETTLSELEYEGFIRRSGESYAVPSNAVLRDWIAFHAACADGGAVESGRPAAEFMRRLLARNPADEPSAPAVAALLESFALQTIPMPLFQYEQYYEALGEIPADKRRQEVLQATSTFRLPEVIGVVHDMPMPSAGSAPPPSLFYAHGFRDGIYRRSNEETWIVGDYTQLPTLTTLEIEQFIGAATDLERRLGSGHYTKWILAGDSVSPVALELLRRHHIYCSASEQLKTFVGLIERPEGRGGRQPLQTRAGLAPHVQSPAPAARRVPVIPIARVNDEDLSASTTRLSVVADQESEVVAAAMAEKVAQKGGFDAEAVGQIKMAVLEGCLNAIEHSPNAEKEVRLTFYQRADELEIAIENEGEVFDPLAVADPDPAAKLLDKNKRGWGIKLMREFMDDVRYEPARGGMCLRLIKKKKTKDKEAVSRPSGAR
jgi:anti-sigma regulatory factor (Ser/Thr protein kinase)